MNLRTAALRAVPLVTLALAAPAAAVAQDGSGVNQKVALKATIKAKPDGSFGGPLSGKPFGKGTAAYTVKVDGDQQRAKYTATFKRGTISGTAVVTATPVAGTDDLTYEGTLDIAKGTKAYRGIKGKDLAVAGRASGGIITLTIKGTVNLRVTTR